jgi:hypothetical protein
MTTTRLTGQVQSSRNYSDTRGQAVHELLLTQGPLSLPVLVRRCFGPTPAGHLVAQRLCQQYRTGSSATVTGQGLGFDRRRHLLVLQAPDHIEPALEQAEPIDQRLHALQGAAVAA